MTTLTETIHAGAFIVSEEEAFYSRDQIAIDNTTEKLPGTVLGKITATGVWDTYDPTKNNGLQTVAGVLHGHVRIGTGGSQQAVALTRQAQVRAVNLTWFAAATAPQIATGKAGLVALGVIPR